MFRYQSIGQAFGGKIVRAKTVMHGRLSDMYHSNKGIFSNLPSPFSATRYHSLVIDQETLPDCLEVTCWTNEADGSMEEIMGVKHKTLSVEGVQFHPESILSQHGIKSLKLFRHLRIRQPSIDCFKSNLIRTFNKKPTAISWLFHN